MTLLSPRLRNPTPATHAEPGPPAPGGRLAALLVDVHGDAAAVVADGARAVGVQDDLDVVAEPAERLVHGVVHGLVHEVVQPVGARVADVHGGALADGLEPLQNLDVARRVGRGAQAAKIPPPLTSKTAAPAAPRGSGVVRNTCSAAPSSRRTSSRTRGASSESASSRSSTGAVPAASAPGRARRPSGARPPGGGAARSAPGRSSRAARSTARAARRAPARAGAPGGSGSAARGPAGSARASPRWAGRAG